MLTHARLSQLAARRAVVAELEASRQILRSERSELGELDARLAAARTELCCWLLEASREARDAGDSDFALALVVEYGSQEYLAKRARRAGLEEGAP